MPEEQSFQGPETHLFGFLQVVCSISVPFPPAMWSWQSAMQQLCYYRTTEHSMHIFGSIEQDSATGESSSGIEC